MTAHALRNVRPRLDAYDDDVDLESTQGDSDVEQQGEGFELSDGELAGVAGDKDQELDQQISNVSFGALKKAQDVISRKRKRDSDTTLEQEHKLEALRERLRQIKEQRSSLSGKRKTTQGLGAPDSTLERTEDSDAESDSDDSDSAPSQEGASKSRTSKHAPAAQSSKHQVSRRRTVVDVPKRQVRDPRFDAMQQRHGHMGDSDRAYGFLQDYQKAEIAELKGAMKRTKNEEEKDILKRKVISMENKLKAKAAKEREQEIVRKHRKQEREQIMQGKTPYYLKKKDIRERAIVEKFKDMKGKDREKLIEKRRRKEGQKEKKRMPQARRGQQDKY